MAPLRRGPWLLVEYLLEIKSSGKETTRTGSWKDLNECKCVTLGSKVVVIWLLPPKWFGGKYVNVWYAPVVQDIFKAFGFLETRIQYLSPAPDFFGIRPVVLT